MKKAAIVMLGCLFCVTVPVVSQSFADNRGSDTAAIDKSVVADSAKIGAGKAQIWEKQKDVARPIQENGAN